MSRYPLADLIYAARVIRDAYPTDPGTSDLYDEQPIHISTTLGAWRQLNAAISAMDAQAMEKQRG